MTGIVAVLFCGITQAHYTYNNLSKESQQSTKNFFDLLNFMAENFIFSYIGVSMFTFPKHHFEPVYICAAFAAIFLGRGLNVYPLSALLNIGRSVKISGNLQHMMMFSGLRGAIAFALAIRNTITESRQMILSTTLLIVITTVIINGGSAISVLKFLGIQTGVIDDQAEKDPIVNTQVHSGYQSVEDGGDKNGNSAPRQSSTGGEEIGNTGTRRPGKSWLARRWAGVDKGFFKPLLTHSYPTLMDTMPNRCLSLARVFTSREQILKHPMMRERESSTSQDCDR